MAISFSLLSSGPWLRVAGGSLCFSWRGRRARGGADLIGDQLAIGQHPLADPQLRLGHKVHRAQLQRPQGDLRPLPGQGRDHHHRHRAQAHQFLQKVEAVHARHFNIQCQHLRIEFFDQIPRDQRVLRGGHHLHIGVAVHDLGHQLAHQRGVIHAQYPDLVHRLSFVSP